MRFRRLIFLGLLYSLAPAAMGDDAEVTCHLETAAMRDGVELTSEVYLPTAQMTKSSQGLPVILIRSPYNVTIPSRCQNEYVESIAAQGYAVVNQDVRGTGRSGGMAEPIHQEALDGYDSVEWAAKQPWSNGKVGLEGASYTAMAALQAAGTAPPSLVAVHSHIMGADFDDGWPYINGTFSLGLVQSWLLISLAQDNYRRQLEARGLPEGEITAKVQSWVVAGSSDMFTEWLTTLPLASFDGFRETAPLYYRWLEHPQAGDYWSKTDLKRRYSRFQVPVLNTGGWYDTFSSGTIKNFNGIRTEAETPVAREQTRLVMYPTCHDLTCGPLSFADVPFSLAGDMEFTLRWWDFWLKDSPNGMDGEPAVQLYVMEPPDTGLKGSGFWLHTDEFPPPGTIEKRFNLGSGGSANSLFGDGTLSVTEAPKGPADRYVYDPRNPVPTMGGNLCCFVMPAHPSLKPGPTDQSQIELRRDVLVYTSAPLKSDLTVIGAVKVNFWASSSARDTDFTAKLVDVHHDGYAHNVVDRIVRARYRAGNDQPPSLLEPGKPYQYDLTLGTTATVFRKGHRIRLEISSSSFPQFDRNTNTGNIIAHDEGIVVAEQAVFHDAAHPSFLILPVLPEQQVSTMRVADVE